MLSTKAELTLAMLFSFSIPNWMLTCYGLIGTKSSQGWGNWGIEELVDFGLIKADDDGAINDYDGHAHLATFLNHLFLFGHVQSHVNIGVFNPQGVKIGHCHTAKPTGLS